MDEFKSSGEREEGRVGFLGVLEEDGFQLVHGKNGSKKKKESIGPGGDEGLKEKRERSKMPFHIPTIPRPQDQYRILVNNLSQPFEHVWLERSEDGTRVIHPLEKLSVMDFVDRSIKDSEMVKPLPLESTPFKLVEGVKELKELAAKLWDASEFAVDLEHNQYRSFQGLTCLMQISTRTEDFIIDTLKLRVYVGLYLREVFKDPSKKKVMHGADRDIEWLQRDFGIYVCNLFDTGQASRVLQLERNSLEYLLHHFCGVNADKEYQNADWRLRPLPVEMLKYAREDTHFLLHIYDLMRQRLLSASSEENDLLLEVYKRSYNICTHLYQKELLTGSSFLYIYGLQEAGFNSNQLAIVAGLHQWRDKIARDEDESTGYILPNKALLEIARHMPVSHGKLRRLVRSKYPFVERHLDNVISIIRSSIANSSAFEIIAEELRQAQSSSTMQNKEEAGDNSVPMPATECPMDSMASQAVVSDVTSSNGGIMQISGNIAASMDDHAKLADTQVSSDRIVSSGHCQQYDKLQSLLTSEVECLSAISSACGGTEKEMIRVGSTDHINSTKNVSTVSVQISTKPRCGFGALLGNSGSKRELNPDKGGFSDQDENVNKVDQIKSAVTLPFLPFPFRDNLSKSQQSDQPSGTTKPEDVIMLENDEADSPQSPSESPMDNDDGKGTRRECFQPIPEVGETASCQPGMETGEEPISLSALSSSFQQCLQSTSQRSGSKSNHMQSQETKPKLQVKLFDYAAAGKIYEFGGVEGLVDCAVNEKSSDRDSVMARVGGEESLRGFLRPVTEAPRTNDDIMLSRQ